LGLLSHTISVQSLQKSIPKVLEERGEERERGRLEERECCVWVLAPGAGELAVFLSLLTPTNSLD